MFGFWKQTTGVKYLGTDAVELTADAEEVWLPVADHDVGDVWLLQAVHHAGRHRALGEMILSHLEITAESEIKDQN